MGKSTAKFTAGVAELKAPGQDHSQSRSGNHAKLAEAGHGAGKPPAGDCDAHAPLNNDGLWH
jgi:hypothetical protein